MPETLCASARCARPDRHGPLCAGLDCPGCLPALAAPGLALCRVHADGLPRDARAAAEVWRELGLRLAGLGSAGQRVSGTPTDRMPDPTVMDVRADIAAVLAGWARVVVEERGLVWPAGRPDVDGVAAMLARHAGWLAAHRAAGEVADDLHEAAHGRGARLAWPDGTRIIDVGGCPRSGCTGRLRAVVRRADSLLPSAVTCSGCGQTWGPAQWHALGRRLREAA